MCKIGHNSHVFYQPSINHADLSCYILGDNDAPTQFIKALAAHVSAEQCFETPNGLLFALPLHIGNHDYMFHFYSLATNDAEAAQLSVQRSDAYIVPAGTHIARAVSRILALSAERPILPLLVSEGSDAFAAVAELQHYPRFARAGQPIDVMKCACSALVSACHAGSLHDYAL